MSAKQFVRRGSKNGDLGYLVLHEGKTHVRLDRPHQEILIPYVESEWVKEDAHRPLTHHQRAQIAFVADCMLCTFYGLHKLAKRDWSQLSAEVRAGWLGEGPKEPQVRGILFKAIMDALQDK